MRYGVVEQSTEELLCDMVIEIKPISGECIVHDGLPYQIGNIVYIKQEDEWFAFLLVKRVGEMQVGKTGGLSERMETNDWIKKVLGL